MDMVDKMLFPVLLTLVILGKSSNGGFAPRTYPRSFLGNVERASQIAHQLTQCSYNLCTSVPNYPEDSIRKAINDKDQLNKWFGEILNETFGPVPAGRTDEEGPTEQLCHFHISKTYFPLAMRNTNEQWKFIVNLDEYKQGFTSQICSTPIRNFKNEMEEARYRKAMSACERFGYTCQQQYQKLYLLAFEDGRIEFDEFAIPTICQCNCFDNGNNFTRK